MTPTELKTARETLGLSQAQLAVLLGYEGTNIRQRVSAQENGHKAVPPLVSRLAQAYLDGYRPADWPLAAAKG